MAALVERGNVILALCNHIRANVPELNLVKPYHGELDRYSKKTQIKEESFPAMVNLQTPFALVISKDRRPVENTGNSRRFKHDLSIYIGDANRHDFNTMDVPPIHAILTKCLSVLDGKVLLKGCGILTVESDGEYLITTDLFTIYDQKYFQLEIGT
jgi:hypothetical protein